jgi:lipopolysaccharide export system protein LptA
MSPLRVDGRLLGGLLLLCAGGVASAASADRLQQVDVSAQTGDATLADGDSILKGSVVITQGSLEIRADQATLTRSKGELTQVVFEGQPASLKQIDDKGDPVSVRARRVTYRPSSNDVLLEGAVEVDRPEGSMQGEVISYDMANGRMNARGDGANDRIRMSFQPRAEADAPVPPADGG